MCLSDGGESTLSRLGVLWGLAALATLLTAFVSSSWLYTREPVTLPNSDITTSVGFRIGLWRICPTVRRINSTIHMPSPACSLVSYSGWEEVRHGDLGIWTPLEFAPSFVSRMRVSTLFEGASVVLILLGTVFALIGHCNGDHKTLIACGLYILGGLSLGSGLVVFATALSETYVEATAGKKFQNSAISISASQQGPQHYAVTGIGPTVPPFDYRYGWSFFAAVVAFIMAELAALFSITAYLRRFPTVEDMVREMVPGAERKLREHQRLSNEYLVRHSGPLPTPSKHRMYQPSSSGDESIIVGKNDGSSLITSHTPPDICTTNEGPIYPEKLPSGGGGISVMMEHEFPMPQSLAGQTVPITIKSHNANRPNRNRPKYGTLPHRPNPASQAQIPRDRGATLQHPRSGKKSVTIGTFQTLDTGYPDFNRRASSTSQYPGSAV